MIKEKKIKGKQIVSSLILGSMLLTSMPIQALATENDTNTNISESRTRTKRSTKIYKWKKYRVENEFREKFLTSVHGHMESRVKISSVPLDYYNQMKVIIDKSLGKFKTVTYQQPNQHRERIGFLVHQGRPFASDVSLFNKVLHEGNQILINEGMYKYVPITYGRSPHETEYEFNVYTIEKVKKKGFELGSVSSTSRSEYPNNGEKGDYWYEYVGEEDVLTEAEKFNKDISEVILSDKEVTFNESHLNLPEGATYKTLEEPTRREYTPILKKLEVKKNNIVNLTDAVTNKEDDIKIVETKSIDTSSVGEKEGEITITVPEKRTQGKIRVTFKDKSTKDMVVPVVYSERVTRHVVNVDVLENLSKMPTEIKQIEKEIKGRLELPIEKEKFTIELLNERDEIVIGRDGQPIKGTVDDSGNITISLEQLNEEINEVKVKITEENKDPVTTDLLNIDLQAPSKPSIVKPSTKDESIVVVIGDDVVVGDKIKVTLNKDNMPKEIEKTIEEADLLDNNKNIVVDLGVALKAGDTIIATVEDKFKNISEESEEITPTTISDNFVEEIEKLSVYQNEEIDITTALKNKPETANVEVITPIDTSSIGEKQGEIKITFDDGSTKNILIGVEVESKTKTVETQTDFTMESISELENNIQDLERRLEQLQNEKEELANDKTALESNLAEKEKELQEAKENLRNSDELIRQLREELETLKQQIQEKENELQEKESELNEVKENLRQQLAQAEEEKAKLKEEIDSLRKNLNDIEEKQRNLEEEKQILKDQLEQEKQKDERNEERISELEREITEKENEIGKLEDEKVDLNNNIVDKENSILEKDKEIENLRQQIEDKDNEISNLKGELEKLKKNKLDLEEKIKGLLEKDENKDNIIKKLEEELKALKEKLESSKENTLENDLRNKELEDKINEKEKELQDLKSQLEELKNKQENIKDLKDELNKYKNENSNPNKDNSVEKNKELKNRLEKLIKELERELRRNKDLDRNEKRRIEDSLDYAKDILNNSNSEKGDLKDAIRELEDILDDIKISNKEDSYINKSNLEDAIKKAEKINKSKLDSYDRKKLEDGITNAKKVLNNKKSTQKEVDRELNNLENLIKKFNEKEREINNILKGSSNSLEDFINKIRKYISKDRILTETISNDKEYTNLKYVFMIDSPKYAESTNKELNIYKMDVKPLIVNGRTMLPLRYVGYVLGAEVKWNNTTRTATFTRNGISIEVNLDSNIAKINNGQTYEMDTKPFIQNNRMLVSLTNIARLFNLTNGDVNDNIDQDIEWNANDKTVTIYVQR